MATFRKTTVWGFALIAILLLFVLFPVQSGPVPHCQTKRNYAEAFEAEEDLGSAPEKEKEEEEEKEKEKTKPADSETIAEGFGFGMMRGNANVKAFSSSVENFVPNDNPPRTLASGPLRDSEIIDKFSQVTSNGVEGKNGCVSSGLTNSGGYICLTPELIKLMTTRGGNATGGDFQVGAPASK